MNSNLREFEHIVSEMASEFRDIAFEIEESPEKINKYLNLQGVDVLSRLMIPEEFNNHPIVVNSRFKIYGSNVLERVIALEKFAYGDVGVLLASPGPSLSGQVIMDMGDPEQQNFYYNTLISEKTWTFFALSEPSKGSDASEIKSKITEKYGNKLLNGEKKFIGNGSRATIGVVFVKSSDGPLGITGLLIDPSRKGFESTTLDTLGVKGAGLSKLTFNNYKVDSSDILGRHLRPTKRGLWGAIQTFNRMRPGVAALGLGVAQATMDYILSNKRNFSSDQTKSIERYNDKILSVRNLIHSAAYQVEHNPTIGYLGSIAKIKAIKLVEEITEYAMYLFGQYAMIEHPYLNKWFRDARALEFMEGTTNIQKLNVFQNYWNGKITHV
ncbi:acyl-CoA dehydrogenase [Virgibacillus pantothenticus]|uniref:acyl-CoA dehydrogenase family protein n=2 Tax=Bacillati TaxID=1783272 RepID=UPI001B1EB8E1|nr:acyl-CoA dehydrogenase family protein [Virgibacillus pantothenticus]GIP63148.1 acyl-CoA dehydrogenase [Virgibacillus pantothenticus]